MTNDPIRSAIPLLPMFLPANRLERLPRATAASADALILDLEDAVAESDKDAARRALVEALSVTSLALPVLVRVNGVNTHHFAADLAAVAPLAIDGIVLPRAETVADLPALRAHLGTERALVALIETARGLADARTLAGQAERLAFGSIDYAATLAMAHEREALLHARAELVFATALAGAAPPLDGVTRQFNNPASVEADARYAAQLGFGGKLMIHPAQIAPAIRGFAPESGAVNQAREILAQSDGNASQTDGAMIDRPVVQAAQRQVKAAERAEQRLAAIAAQGSRS